MDLAQSSLTAAQLTSGETFNFESLRVIYSQLGWNILASKSSNLLFWNRFDFLHITFLLVEVSKCIGLYMYFHTQIPIRKTWDLVELNNETAWQNYIPPKRVFNELEHHTKSYLRLILTGEKISLLRTEKPTLQNIISSILKWYNTFEN